MVSYHTYPDLTPKPTPLCLLKIFYYVPELKVSYQKIPLHLQPVLLILRSPFCSKLNLASLMTLPAALSSGSSFLSCFLHTIEPCRCSLCFSLLFPDHSLKISPNFISCYQTVPSSTYPVAVIFHPCLPFIGDFVKTFKGLILPHLQANKLTTTVSWILAEGERFLGQKPSTLLLTAKAGARVTVFAYIGSSSPSYQSVT